MFNICNKTKNKYKALATLAVLGVSTNTMAGPLFVDFNSNLVTANASIFLFGDANQTASVTSLSGFSESVTLNSEGFANVFLPNSLQQSGTGVTNTGLTINSDDPLAGYFVNRAGASTDATYLLDSDATGKEYVVASQGAGFGEGSQVMIRALEDNTTVTFTPKGSTAITVTLSAGETYKYAGGSVDLTGSTVSSDKNVGVSSGHECAQVPVGLTFCDTLIEQMIPTQNLSTNYLVTASDGAELAVSDSDLVRVIATADNTVVSVGGAMVATLNKGEVYEFDLAAGSGAEIEATQKVMVAQYLKGGAGANTDPAMALVPGADTWLDAYRLATPDGAQAFNLNYASVVLDTNDLASLFLDGALVDTSSFSEILGTGFSRGIVDLGLGLFELEADSDFLVMLGGGSSADSYFTYGGSTFAPGISPPPPPPPPIDASAPSSLVLAGLGLLLLGARRRKN